MQTIINRLLFSNVLSRPQSSDNRDTNEVLINEYLSWKQSYSRSAYKSYRLWVTRFQQFANKPPETLTHNDYVRFADTLTGRHESRGIEFALNVVHNYLRYFAEQGRLRFPLYLVRVPRGVSNSHPAITEEEYQRVKTALRGRGTNTLRDRALIMLLHDTGMRIGEALSLNIDDIEEDMSAVVRTEKTVSRRRVFWNPDTDVALHAHLVERVNNGPKTSERLFATKRQKGAGGMSPRSVQRMFKEAVKRAGITRRLCLHSFRHSFIHRMAKLGAPDAIISQLVGHSTPLTISHYTKLSRPEMQDYARKQLLHSSQMQAEMALAA